MLETTDSTFLESLNRLKSALISGIKVRELTLNGLIAPKARKAVYQEIMEIASMIAVVDEDIERETARTLTTTPPPQVS